MQFSKTRLVWQQKMVGVEIVRHQVPITNRTKTFNKPGWKLMVRLSLGKWERLKSSNLLDYKLDNFFSFSIILYLEINFNKKIVSL